MSRGPLPDAGVGYSLIAPAVVIRPILLEPFSVNQSAPSGPAVMPAGPAPNARGYSVKLTDYAGESAQTLSNKTGTKSGRLSLDENDEQQLVMGNL